MSLIRFLWPSRLPLVARAALVFLAIPVVALVGCGWLLFRLAANLRLVGNLRLLANDRLCCPAGHHVPIYGKWRCPTCHGVWQGPGHRCPCCGSPMSYLVCQEPGCGLATKLPRFF